MVINEVGNDQMNDKRDDKTDRNQLPQIDAWSPSGLR